MLIVCGRRPKAMELLELLFLLVVCEVPEARLSVNDKTTDSDEVYFNTKVHIYTK